MTQTYFTHKCHFTIGLLSTLAFSTMGVDNRVVAQVTPDNTMGVENSTVTPTTVNGIPSDLIKGGATRGQNLFHSFLNFSVLSGRGAYFSNPAGIANILSRITGSNPSNIDGTLGVLGSANLFLLNPNGIVFGPNASLDVRGSFLASTASGVQFGDQGSFNAINPTAPGVLTLNPSALLFNQIAAQPINSQANLQVQDGRSLMLAGGNINLDGGSLRAAGGRVELASLAGSGGIELNFGSDNLSFGTPSSARADISLTNSVVEVNAPNAGSISIYGKNLNFSGSDLLSGTSTGDGGDISLNASEAILLQNAAVVQTITTGPGTGSDIFVTANQLTLQESSLIDASTAIGQGRGGNLTVNTNNSVTLSSSSGLQTGTAASGGESGDVFINTRQLQLQSGGFVNTITNTGGGKGGDIVINASESVTLSGNITRLNAGTTNNSGDSGNILINTQQSGNILINTQQLRMQDSAFIAALTSLSQGRGGDITINASDSIILAGDSQVQTSTFTAGESGDIFLNTKQLVMQDEALITSLTFAGSGRGGDITINASNAVILDGPEVGLTADSTPGGGDAGTISITTGQLLMQRNAVITATTLSASRGGDININATELVSLVGSSTDNLFPVIASQSNGTGKAGDITIRTGSLTLEAGALISAGTFSTGDAGNIFIDVEKLQVLSGSQIQASAALRSTGNAGSLAINASDSIIVSGVLESNPDEFASALLVQTGGSGAPGRLAISTKDLWVENGALISTSTLGNSDGGELIINADTIALQGTTPDGQFASGLGVITRGSGNGGNLRLTAKKLTIKDGAAIEASTFSSGDAGTITLQIADMLTITGTASGIYSDTNVDAVGQGGEIFISTGQLMMDNGAIISSSTFGSGTAGDIAINAEQVFLDSGAQIFASTFGAGNGGTITLQVVDSIILTGTSSSTPSGLFAIAATGSSGNAGSVVITTGNLTVQDGANISTRTDGSGNAGDLSITTNMLTAQRGATISTQTSSAGRAGDLTINTNQLLVDGAQISTSTSGSGAGGTFIINATDSITLTGTTDDFLSGLFTASEGGSGNAGNLFLTAGRLTLQDEAVISAATFGSGDAGDLTINVNQLLVEGGAKILSSTFSEGNGGTLTVTATDSITLTGVDDNGFVSGLFTAAEVGSSGNAGALFVTTGQLTVQDGAVISAATAGSGDAGDITINAKQIQLAGGGQIVSTTSGTGDGGTITVTAADSITLTGSDQNGEFPSGFFPATAATSSGNAGTLFVITEALTVSDGAEISSQALGSGNAGDLNITANALNLDNGSLVASAAEGGGGDIILDAEDIVLTNNSLISTNVFNSTGGGGEITINADLFIALENSDILATAVQGPGGNITITANTFLADVLANNGPTPSTEADFNTLRTNGRVDISATSQESVSGQISTPDVTFLESNLQELGVAFISSDQLVAGSCLNRQQVGPNPSSFSVSGTGGLPQTPYAAIQMNYAAAEIDATQNSSQSVQTGSNSSQESANTYTVKAWKLGDRIQEASGILITSDGRQLLSDRAQAHALKSSDALVCR